MQEFSEISLTRLRASTIVRGMDKLPALESAAQYLMAARAQLRDIGQRTLAAECDELISEIRVEIAHESRRLSQKAKQGFTDVH